MNSLFRNLQNKRSQSDMLGVVIIVAFLIFVIIFVVVLAVTSQKDTLSAEYKMNSLTSNFLTTVFRTTACNTYSLTELVVDCSKPQPSINCGGFDSCLQARRVLWVLFNKTLDEWHENYYFNITDMPQDFYYSRGDCENTSIGLTPSTLPIPAIESGKTLYATLTICK